MKQGAYEKRLVLPYESAQLYETAQLIILVSVFFVPCGGIVTLFGQKWIMKLMQVICIRSQQ